MQKQNFYLYLRLKPFLHYITVKWKETLRNVFTRDVREVKIITKKRFKNPKRSRDETFVTWSKVKFSFILVRFLPDLSFCWHQLRDELRWCLFNISTSQNDIFYRQISVNAVVLLASSYVVKLYDKMWN